MAKKPKHILQYIGDDGELLQPFPLSDVTEDNDDLGDFIGGQRMVYYHPDETRGARLKRCWGRVWLPCLLFLLCILSIPVPFAVLRLIEWLN